MNVASLELCKELYELSGWEPEGHDYYCEYQGQTVNTAAKVGEYICPAYDLGYLLRKLPPEIHDEFSDSTGNFGLWQSQNWTVGYVFDEGEFLYLGESEVQAAESASTPEDAACKLAIQLFKQGILTKSQERLGDE